ncbi:MAG: AzlD domain-containing protein, partial [Pseudomonadota bacterium]
MMDDTTIWIVIILLGLGSYGLRFFFIGIVGDRPLPPWLLRHLRYTAVAILPGLVAPLVLWPAATDGSPDPA